MDPFDEYTQTPAGPLSSALEIIPSDTDDCPVIGRAFNVVSHGAYDVVPVTVTLMNGPAVELGLAPGINHELRVKRLHETGTQAGARFTTLW